MDKIMKYDGAAWLIEYETGLKKEGTKQAIVLTGSVGSPEEANSCFKKEYGNSMLINSIKYVTSEVLSNDMLFYEPNKDESDSVV